MEQEFNRNSFCKERLDDLRLREEECWLVSLPIESREDTHDIATSSCTGYDTLIAVDELHELPNNKRHTLNSLQLFSSSIKLSLQILLFVFDILLLTEKIRKDEDRKKRRRSTFTPGRDLRRWMPLNICKHLLR